MEKKRRARINVSLEQLKTLLEKHYSHQVSSVLSQTGRNPEVVAVRRQSEVWEVPERSPAKPLSLTLLCSADPKAQTREGRHSGTERQIHEKLAELSSRWVLEARDGL